MKFIQQFQNKFIKRFQLWLDTNPSVRYLATFVCICICFVGFITSRIYLEKPVLVSETVPNQVIFVEGKGYSWGQKQVNEDRSEVTILFKVDVENPDNTSKTDLQIIPELKNMSLRNSTVTIFKGSENFYVLNIKNLPKDWETFRVKVGEQGKANQALFYFNRESSYMGADVLLTKDQFEPTQEYTNVYATLYEIEMIQRYMEQTIVQKQNGLRENITQLESEITDLGKDLEYKTNIEKTRREERIANLRKEQDGLRGQIQQLDTTKKEYEERIANLKRKVNDQKQAYHLSF